MEKLIVLGTGNAQAVHCYNTCFAMKNGEEYTIKLDMLLQGGDSLLMTNTIIFKLKIKREKVYN